MAQPLVTRERGVGLGDTESAGLIGIAVVFRWAEVLLSDWLCQLGRPLGIVDPGRHRDARWSGRSRATWHRSVWTARWTSRRTQRT